MVIHCVYTAVALVSHHYFTQLSMLLAKISTSYVVVSMLFEILFPRFIHFFLIGVPLLVRCCIISTVSKDVFIL